MDSFYVELPSSTPFPGNKTSDYLVKLPNILDLSDGNWTVALSSISYPLSFSGVDEEQLIIINYNNGTKTTINLPKRLQYSSIKQFENVLNDTILGKLFNETKVGIRTKRDSRPRPPAKTQPKQELDNRPRPPAKTQPEQDTDNKPRPPAKTQPEKGTQPPLTQEQTKDERPKPPLKDVIEDKATEKPHPPTKPRPEKQPEADKEKEKQEQLPTKPETLPEKPQEPEKKEETTKERPRPPTKEPPMTKPETKKQPESEEEKDDRPKPSPKTMPEEQHEEEAEKTLPHIQLDEKDKQALETAKRVSIGLLKEVETGFDKMEEFYKETNEIIVFVRGHSVPENAIAAMKLKNSITSEDVLVTNLQNAAVIALNKAREGKVKASIEYANQNVKGAKIATDQIKKARKDMLGDMTKSGYVKEFEKIKDRVLEYFEKFAKEVGLPSRNLKKIYEDGITFARQIEKVYYEINEIYNELSSIMDDVKKIETPEADNVLTTMEPIIALKSFVYPLYVKLLELKQELEKNYDERKVETAQKTLEQIKTINHIILIEKEDLNTARQIKDRTVKAYNKLKTIEARKNFDILKKSSQIQNDEEKTDEWHNSDEINKHTRVFGEESYSEGHIPKTIIMSEKIDNDIVDSWNVYDSKEIDLFSYRKDEIENRIKHSLSNKIEITGVKELIRSDYQQIYFYYDEDQLQRFYFWTSTNDLFKIKHVQLSRQLAYMLGFEANIKGTIVNNSFAKYSPDVTGGLHSFYVYSPNLIANSIIGNQYGPLLRVVDVDLSSNKKVEQTIYTQEFHHKILLKQIPEIRIKILSNSGRPIEFNWGECRVSLHFRRSIF